jgi:hypothetical protein
MKKDLKKLLARTPPLIALASPIILKSGEINKKWGF